MRPLLDEQLTPLRCRRAEALAQEVIEHYDRHGARDLETLAFVLDWRHDVLDLAVDDAARLGLIELDVVGSTIYVHAVERAELAAAA